MYFPGILAGDVATRNSNLFSLGIQQSKPIPLDVTLNCAAGELLALVGPSGSGKSTLLRMIAGLSRPAAGHITCDEHRWFDAGTGIFLSPQQRRVGYLPQHYGLFPHMSALDNVRAGLHNLGRNEQLQRAGHWLQRMHLTGLEHRQPAELSGGQQQRVAMARALAGDPAILLLDEPFSAIDTSMREKLHGELAELKSQLAIPIIMVTHNLNEALMLADRMSLLSEGITLQSGVPGDIVAKPANQAAARLLGIHNMFESEIVAHDADRQHTRLRLGDHLLDSPFRPEFKVGELVRWAIADSGIRFRAISRSEQAFRHNRLDLTVSKILRLGDEARVTMLIDGVITPLQVTIPSRLANELALSVGLRTQVMLRAQNIHLLQLDHAQHE